MGRFAQWLLDVGHGRATNEDGNITFPGDIRCATSSNLIDFIYPGIGSPTVPSSNYFLNRIILAPRNGDVGSMNTDILGRMGGAERVYVSADSVITEAGADAEDAQDVFPVEFLRSLNAPGLPAGELHLKTGCPLILLRNLSPSQGLCNGTRMTVLRMTNRVLECQIIGGDHDGNIAFIPRISLTPSGNLTEFAFAMQWRQFPIALAFAITINKAQGQSAKYFGVDLQIPVFAHGQLL